MYVMHVMMVIMAMMVMMMAIVIMAMMMAIVIMAMMVMMIAIVIMAMMVMMMAIVIMAMMMMMAIVIMAMNTFARKPPLHSSHPDIVRQMVGEEAEARLFYCTFCIVIACYLFLKII